MRDTRYTLGDEDGGGGRRGGRREKALEKGAPRAPDDEHARDGADTPAGVRRDRVSRLAHGGRTRGWVIHTYSTYLARIVCSAGGRTQGAGRSRYGGPIEYNMTESEGQDPRTPAAYWIRREWGARVQDGRSVEKLEVGVCAGGEGRTSAGPIAI